jgi:hypothetical protein
VKGLGVGKLDTKLNQKEWLDLINRLQERERQKISSSGLSNWTLFAALGGLGYWILPEIPSIQKNFVITLLGYTIFHNLTTSLFDIFNRLYRNKKILKYRFPKTELDRKGNLPLVLHEISMLTVAMVLNGYFVYFFFQKGKHILLFVYFGLYVIRYSYNLLGAISAMLYKYMRDKVDLIETQEMVEAINEKQKSKVIKKIVRLFISIRLKLFMTVITLLYIWNQYTLEKDVLKLALDGLALSLIVLMTQFLLMIFIKRMKIAWLENLEKEIILNNLSQEQVIQRLRNKDI